jgi:hypothetical protein
MMSAVPRRSALKLNATTMTSLFTITNPTFWAKSFRVSFDRNRQLAVPGASYTASADVAVAAGIEGMLTCQWLRYNNTRSFVAIHLTDSDYDVYRRHACLLLLLLLQLQILLLYCRRRRRRRRCCCCCCSMEAYNVSGADTRRRLRVMSACRDNAPFVHSLSLSSQGSDDIGSSSSSRSHNCVMAAAVDCMRRADNGRTERGQSNPVIQLVRRAWSFGGQAIVRTSAHTRAHAHTRAVFRSLSLFDNT